ALRPGSVRAAKRRGRGRGAPVLRRSPRQRRSFAAPVAVRWRKSHPICRGPGASGRCRHSNRSLVLTGRSSRSSRRARSRASSFASSGSSIPELKNGIFNLGSRQGDRSSQSGRRHSANEKAGTLGPGLLFTPISGFEETYRLFFFAGFFVFFLAAFFFVLAFFAFFFCA